MALIITGFIVTKFSLNNTEDIGNNGDNGERGTIPVLKTIDEECVDLGCPSGTIYVGSINSDKYYGCDCRYAKSVLPENIVCFASDEDALAEDRVKSVC